MPFVYLNRHEYILSNSITYLSANILKLSKIIPYLMYEQNRIPTMCMYYAVQIT